MMKRGPQGYLLPVNVPGESYKCFIPEDLPPQRPLELGPDMHDLLELANRSLGRLDGVAMLLPDVTLFLYFYVRKEAILSSQIEGTQSSLSDLLMYENSDFPGMTVDEVVEVSNYVAAMQVGLQALSEGELLTHRLITRIHSTLLSTGRGSEKSPGEFRRTQNWIRGTRPGNALYVPPPPTEVNGLMAGLDRFVHDTPNRTPALIKAALAHVQFETIHPFLDGNGRLGRLLITLILCNEKALSQPLLYLSLYFKTHRDEYYQLLQDTRMNGDWEKWLCFFLNGVRATSDQAVAAAQQIIMLFETDRRRIEGIGRASGSALRLHHLLQRKPLITAPLAGSILDLSKPTIQAAMDRLSELGIVRQLNERKRNRTFVYQEYLNILSEGTEPIQ